MLTDCFLSRFVRKYTNRNEISFHIDLTRVQKAGLCQTCGFWKASDQCTDFWTSKCFREANKPLRNIDSICKLNTVWGT